MNALHHDAAARGRLARTLAAAAGLLACWAAGAGTLGVFTSDDKGFDTHTFYYDDGQEVVLIDTQFVPQLTEKMVAQVKATTRSPITRVVVTHPNPDKFNGLAYLHRLGVRSISSAAVADDMPAVNAYKKAFWTKTMKAFPPDGYPAFENVQQRFDGPSHTLKLKSGETLTLFALRNPGVAAHQVVLRVDGTGDLVVGDLLHHRAHAWLEGPLVGQRPVPDIGAWNAALDELPALATGHPEAKVYGGRGEFVRVADAVKAQKTYLTQVRGIVAGYVDGLGAKRAELALPATAAPHYDALTQRVAAAFPDYKLPYMVKYSVYGLANAEAARIDSRASR
jgi:glyoxylase-like metal-dependent hydrolase (beta-lactamase superfamily II)